jgi:hypothetical protein
MNPYLEVRSMPQFHETRMGKQFYEGTMPAIQRALANIARELERANDKEATAKEAAEKALREKDPDGTKIATGFPGMETGHAYLSEHERGTRVRFVSIANGGEVDYGVAPDVTSLMMLLQSLGMGGVEDHVLESLISPEKLEDDDG